MEKMNEIWRPIVNFEGLYDVSNIGRVRSLNYRGHNKKEILKSYISNNGYVYIRLTKNGKNKLYRVHRLVAMAFIPNPNNLPIINHKNEIKTDNRAENLEWCTHSYNWKYSGIDKKAHNAACQVNKKPVLQYSKTGELLNEYESLSEASQQIAIPYQCISACCRGELKSSGGYIWRFKSEC